MTKKKEITSIKELLDKVKEYDDNIDNLNKIVHAFNFAKEKHYGKERLTGDDYIIHPLNVAAILTDIQVIT